MQVYIGTSGGIRETESIESEDTDPVSQMRLWEREREKKEEKRGDSDKWWLFLVGKSLPIYTTLHIGAKIGVLPLLGVYIAT